MQLLEYWTHDTNYILCIILIHINSTMTQAGLIHRRRVMLLMEQALYPQTTMAGYRTSINILFTIAFALHVLFFCKMFILRHSVLVLGREVHQKHKMGIQIMVSV